MTVRLTLLGTGTSFGVPQIGCTCEVCRSDDPRDRRSRTAALVDRNGSTLLVDTPPELRLQLVTAGRSQVDAVLFTHDHADHVHGIDDLRAISGRARRRLAAYGLAGTMARLAGRFPYIFDASIVPPPGTFVPELDAHPLEPGRETEIAGIPVLPLAVDHGGMQVLGFRFGPVAYVTDVKRIPAEARSLLAGVRVLVLSALFERPHPAHLSIPEALETVAALGIQQTWLTHLTHETAHRALEARLPPHVRPAYDGLVLEVDE